MRVFEGLKFKRVSTPIHKLDPRVKFFISCIIFITAILFNELLPLLILFFAQLPLILIARVHREWVQSLKGASIFAVMIFVMNLVVGYMSPTSSFTISFSLAMAIRFLVLVASFSCFFLTTSPDDLGLALEQSRIPYEFCFAFTTAVRFVPVLANEAQTIVDAQRSRGLELEKGNFMKRVRNYIPILIPLIVSAIRRSLELAEAMESRAFGAKKTRTSLYSLKMKSIDYFVIILTLALFLFAVYIRMAAAIPRIEI
ncbi:energy-coupling factor transporter transmembrane protein EcfT [Candidatus Bathyarchaeota archaeon]|nr:energy-coupling factor transporter transmembrane protein EcfT [Candidatus Bathyarchaeota archaeon]